MDEILKVDEVAKMLGVKKSKAYRLVTEGDIESFRVGKSIRVKSDDVVSFLEKNNYRAGEKITFARKGVYFVRAAGVTMVKIGKSSQLKTRIRSIQSENAIDVKLLGFVEGDDYSKYEKKLQELAKFRCVHNEWFEFSHDEILEIEKAFSLEAGEDLRRILEDIISKRESEK